MVSVLDGVRLFVGFVIGKAVVVALLLLALVTALGLYMLWTHLAVKYLVYEWQRSFGYSKLVSPSDRRHSRNGRK